MEEQILSILAEIDEDIPSYDGNLFDAGLLDSFNVIEIVSRFEEIFGVEVDAGDVIEENFHTKNAIVDVLRKYLEKKIECKNALLFVDELDDLKGIDIGGKKYFYKSIDKEINYDGKEWNQIKSIIESNEIDTLIGKEKDINVISRLLWECDQLMQYILIDTENERPVETENKQLNEKVWDLTAYNAKNAIMQSGWKNSKTREWFSDEEMRESVNNTYTKLLPYLNKETKVMEIGVGSGLICEAVAPDVKEYIGIDISDQTLSITEKRLTDKGIKNIAFFKNEAVNVNSKGFKDIDLIIMNSVSQCFPGYNYFIQTIENALSCMSDQGIIFVGDILDYDEREHWRNELNKNGKVINKRDLWYSRKFIDQLPAFIKGIDSVDISGKLYDIENELSLYRYDAMIYVDKNKEGQIARIKHMWAVGG